jgi:hypothetical protein
MTTGTIEKGRWTCASGAADIGAETSGIPIAFNAINVVVARIDEDRAGRFSPRT